MGETQIYSQRLHGITEKRRLLDDVDRIQRELEQQKLKLQQLKRKSLRDRWLMDGLVPSPGAEIENPLNQTEDKIKNLEHELESLQLQLLYLENPDMKIAHLKKHQVSDPPRQLVNGDPSQQTSISDQKDSTSVKKENQKEHKVIQEEDLQPNGEDGKQGQVVDPSKKDPTPSKDVVVVPPIPAPRGKKVEKNHEQSSSDQKLNIVDQRNEEEHYKEIRNVNHSLEPQDERSENLELKDKSREQEHDDTDKDLLTQISECLDKRLVFEEENVEHLTNRLEHVDLSFNEEGHTVNAIQPSLSNEDIRNDLDNQYNVVRVTLLDEGEQHENETKPSPVMDQDEPLVRDNNSQDEEHKPVLVSIIQDQKEEIIAPVANQDQNEDSALPRCQGEPVDFVPVLIGHDKDQDLGSTSFPAHQSLELLSSDQEQSPKLFHKVPDPSLSLPCEVLVNQVQISQVVVISPPAHISSEDLAQHSLDSQSPSTNIHHQPGTTEVSAPAENQPLLHKPAVTDVQSDPRGTNTAESRDKNPPGKKKSCQCCVVM